MTRPRVVPEGSCLLLDYLQIDEPNVFNHLVDQKSIESVLVCRTQAVAKQLMTHRATVPDNVSYAITHDLHPTPSSLLTHSSCLFTTDIRCTDPHGPEYLMASRIPTHQTIPSLLTRSSGLVTTDARCTDHPRPPSETPLGGAALKFYKGGLHAPEFFKGDLHALETYEGNLHALKSDDLHAPESHKSDLHTLET